MTTTLKNVLAATDFSGPSRHAAERAARLAHEAGAHLQLLHVLSGRALTQLQHLLGLDSAVEQDLIDEARRTLDNLASELALAQGVAIETKLVSGAVLEEIGGQADALDADLVVLGARGAGFMRRMVLGSTAERLLRKTRHPLLVVRQKSHERYRRVLIPVDFSQWSASALALARRVAPSAHFVLLHAYEVPFEGKLRFAGVDEVTIKGYRRRAEQSATKQLHALAAGAGLKPADWSPCVLYGDASLCINEQEQEQDCDLIVIGKHGQNMAEDLLLGSVTKHVLAESAGDVLVSTLKLA